MADKTTRVPVSREYVAVPKNSIERRRRHRYRMGRSRGFGTEGAMLIVGAGAVIALLANLEDLKDSKAAKERWWLVPLAVVAIGYFLRKKGNPYGGVVLAVGGSLFALAYAASAKKENGQKAPAPPKQVKGETGAVDAPFVVPAGSGHAWLRLPNGQFLRVPLLAREPQQFPMGTPAAVPRQAVPINVAPKAN